ncbi:MAG: type II toxin-antitoxin system RelE/ParE family toxin [Defluviitaleaceae bacterium]|nr:type II toxin-antitoxin system RelE/ParE family toxin [Defluviitaleaceae bacterium]
MTREFIMTKTFDKLWSSLALNDEDLRQLQNMLLKNPLIGDIIQGTGGARKIRSALPHTGKSGGIRIIYFDMIHLGKLLLILCYPKSKQDDLSQEQKSQIRAAIEALKEV